ncbi:unnamed protein product [Caenorhabditis brenneri]
MTDNAIKTTAVLKTYVEHIVQNFVGIHSRLQARISNGRVMENMPKLQFSGMLIEWDRGSAGCSNGRYMSKSTRLNFVGGD